MRAAAIDRFGSPDVLTIHTLPVPKPGPHEVLIEMHAAGVGVRDAAMRRGEYSDGTERFPIVLGTDGAGVIVSHGADVPTIKREHLKVIIAKTYKLAEAAQTHERLEQGRVIGRSVLQIR